MSTAAARARLRQAVLVAADLEPAASALRAALGLGEPFRDPGVGQFGLANVVFAIGDCFIEIVSPTRAGTAAGRQLERGGDGGYMAIFDLEDLAGARARAAQLGVRVVWQIDLPDIAGTHLHPADMRGAIVSLDRSEPYGAWRWGGPEWTARIGTTRGGRAGGDHGRCRRPDGRAGALGRGARRAARRLGRAAGARARGRRRRLRTGRRRARAKESARSPCGPPPSCPAAAR